MIGKIVPPERAVFEGVKGASARSARATAYPSVKVRRPIARTSNKASRRPSPDRSYPSANMNAAKMSQTVPLLNPERAQDKDAEEGLKPGLARSLGLKSAHLDRSAIRVTPMSPISAPGMGSKTRATTTPAKIAK